MKEEFVELPLARHYRLTHNSIDKIKVSLSKNINCRVEEINIHYDNKKGYYFYGPYNICVADLLFEGSEYRGVQIYGGIIEDLKIQLIEERKRILEENRRRIKEEQRAEKERERQNARKEKTKYVLQKYVVPGVLITTIGIGALAGIGAIKNVLNSEPTQIVEQTPALNTIANANDILLYSWANYALSEIYDIAEESEYEAIKAMPEMFRAEYFTPIVSSYYNYVEEGLLDLPLELTGDSIKTNHNSFRNNAYLFDEELQDKGMSDCSFKNSPFANAIVVDSYGKVVMGTDNGLFGEIYDSNGDLITIENDTSYTIYIRAEDVLGNDYGTSNYPDDAIMYEGVAYVSSSHLNDFESPSMSTK